MRMQDLGIAAVTVGVTIACASGGGAPPAVGSSGRSCAVATIDTTFAGLGPVYRDCDVDQPAKRMAVGGPPNFSGVRPRPCMSVDLEFVVDEHGRPIATPLRIVRATSDDFAQAMAATVPAWHYSPAIKDGHAVRQLVHAHEMVQTRVQRVPMGSGAPPMSEAGEPPSGSC